MPTSILECGASSFVLTVLGIAGFVAAIFALVLMSIRAQLAVFVAVGAVLIGAASLAIGAMSANQVSGGVLALAMEASGQDRVQLVEHAGDAARLCFGMGLKGGVLPVTAGAIALGVTLFRKKNTPRKKKNTPR